MQEKVCYIDDCKANRSLIFKSLSDSYETVSFYSPDTIIDELKVIKPDLILLDVAMPDKNGYECCRLIKGEPELTNVPVVFLTCRNELEDRLSGYESGGDGYIAKPFEISELKYIIRSQLNSYKNLLNAETKADRAEKMSWSLMRNNNEIGQVVQYARELANTYDEVELIKHTFASLNGFGLSSIILISMVAGEAIARSDGQPFTIIEEQLIQMAKHGNRITKFGSKYIFTGKNCVFFIKNMPIHDEEFTGRLRDHLAIMLESCDACIELINLRHQEHNHQNILASETQEAVVIEFEKIIEFFCQMNTKVKSTFDDLSLSFGECFMSLGLTMEQEQHLNMVIEKAREDIDRYLDAGASLNEAMQRVKQSVRKMVSGKDTLI